ncbi:hypothetical protein [Maridesulfovibrio bastinii]|jgi:hypothetical protein|uniref:hypothetical protein n=1 Tax=Maridesulfovibrio bastinii TaxID=47157 RepID=UPI0003FFA902|nr:hypothetical protein [Maridesulfovibrio bastinii]
MSEEISFDSLGLKKPLDKMTTKELRELCINKLTMIVGVSGMSKEDIVAKIKEVFGFTEEGGVSPYKDQIFAIKKEIRELREKRAALESRNDRDIMRRKINKLKKRTRALARVQ